MLEKARSLGGALKCFSLLSVDFWTPNINEDKNIPLRRNRIAYLFQLQNPGPFTRPIGIILER